MVFFQLRPFDDEILNHILLYSGLCINPETKRPYPTSIVEKGLKDIHFSVKPNRSSKQQALEVIPQLKTIMKIDRAQMRVRITVTGNVCKSVAEKAEKLGSTEAKEFSGSTLSMVKFHSSDIRPFLLLIIFLYHI